MRWVYTSALAWFMASAMGASTADGSLTAAQPACLHGDGESADQVTRRQSALGFTREINTFQAHAFQTSNSYQPLAMLKIKRTAPDGFAVKLSTEGGSYSFSLVDQTDPCKFGYFSNDAAVIYKGEAIR